MSGANDILRERIRQLAIGRSPEHDDAHKGSELVHAAECYIVYGFPELKVHADINRIDFVVAVWPWRIEEFHPGPTPRENLVIAGALIAAEIDRLDRMTS